MVNKDRLVDLFLELVQIDSISQQEAELAQRLIKELKYLGLKVRQDDKGNIIAYLKGNLRNGKTILFNAHMDTVVPGKNVKPIVKKDRITSDGSTILGADDKAGIAIIIEILRILKERQVLHGDIKVIFTVEEEIGLKGAKSLEVEDVQADYCFVLDADGDVGTVVNRSPAQDSLEIIIKGKPAHAGICPQKGISAIQIAAKAISGMKLGKIDQETTANMGVIKGGRATNIIPEEVIVKGEARSHSLKKLERQVKHIIKRFKKAAEELGGEVDIKISRSYNSVAVPNNSPIIKLTEVVAKQIGFKHKVVSSGGGSDASVIYAHGVPTVAISIGMENVHSKQEYIKVKNLHDAAKYIVGIVRTVNKQ
ncbi:MAG: M20/M25/M40 family metallo-hydrolase [Candidatus Margulisbacteria bacterium]|nr:M20/M25/M40 family metallo-hydrolase [Candidatus Margulisiibacteriota bacterium]